MVCYCKSEQTNIVFYMNDQNIYEFSLKDFKDSVSGYKHNFKNIENIPQCKLYSYSADELAFEPDPGNSDFLLLNVPIKKTLELLNDYCEIHSYKWFRVRKKISQLDVINYPWISVGSEGEVFLMDGRHRLLGMMLLKGMTHVDVNVEKQHFDIVKSYFEKMDI